MDTSTGQLPQGEWVIVQFSLKPAMGFDGGFVDLMNPDTTNSVLQPRLRGISPSFRALFRKYDPLCFFRS